MNYGIRSKHQPLLFPRKITGLVNDEEMLKKLKDVVGSDMRHQRFSAAQNFLTSSAPDVTEFEEYDEDADIGDCVFAVDGPDGTVYYGESDATHLARLE